ncbi:MarR family transcriptional regulator [Spirochaetia bacterium]|nr:MarR family transcriptional regulator [Spirochaetia bacterium]
MRDDILKLENQLCFPLYACSKEVIRRYTPFLDAIDLTYTQYIVMMVLWERQRITVKELGECLYLDSGTLTPLLKRLEKKKLIRRSRSDRDERQVVLMITETGIALKDRAREVPVQMGKCIDLSAEEAGELYRLLHKLLTQLE